MPCQDDEYRAGALHPGQGIVLAVQLPTCALAVNPLADYTVDQHKIPDCPANWINRPFANPGARTSSRSSVTCGSMDFVRKSFSGLSEIRAVRLRQNSWSAGLLSPLRTTSEPPPKAVGRSKETSNGFATIIEPICRAISTSFSGYPSWSPRPTSEIWMWLSGTNQPCSPNSRFKAIAFRARGPATALSAKMAKNIRSSKCRLDPSHRKKVWPLFAVPNAGCPAHN